MIYTEFAKSPKPRQSFPLYNIIMYVWMIYNDVYNFICHWDWIVTDEVASNLIPNEVKVSSSHNVYELTQNIYY